MSDLLPIPTLSTIARWVDVPLVGDKRSQNEWIALFARTVEVPKPDEPLTVYRGTCWEEYRIGWIGMSWTTDRNIAARYCQFHHFFHGGDCRSPRVILHTVIQPESVVADLRNIGNPEKEIVANPRLLRDISIDTRFGK